MGFGDKLKQFGDKARESAADLSEKAKESAAEHREQISSAVETAGVVADRRTRGRYTDKIMKAANRTEAAVDKFAGADGEAAGEATAGAPPVPDSQTGTVPSTPASGASTAAPAEPPVTPPAEPPLTPPAA